MAKKQVIAYLHTHWDREWYRTKEDFNLRLLEVFDEILDELESDSMPAFYFDGQTCALLDYLKFRPEKFDLIKKLIKAKKLYVGPFFVSADNFLTSGISLVRNLDLGIKYAKSLGNTDFIGYLPDTFGHSGSIFDILKSFNILYSLVWRGVGPLEHNDFEFRGIKTTKLKNGYFMDELHTISAFSPGSKEFLNHIKNLEKILDKIAENSDGAVLLPVGADHLACLKNANTVVKNVNKYLENYTIVLASPFEYIKKADYSRLSMTGELLDNSETYILPGVYSSRIPQKVDNAYLQWQLFRIVEPLNYFLNRQNLSLGGLKYSPSLDYAVSMLLKNHAHDSIYGCSLDEVHNSVQTRFDKVKAVTEGIKQRLIRDFKREYLINPEDKAVSGGSKLKNVKSSREKIGLFNLSNYEFSGSVRVITDYKMKNAQLVRTFKGFSDEILYDTRQIPVTEQYLPRYEYLIEVNGLQPFTFSQIEPVKPASSLEISDTKIANPNLELNISRRGQKLSVNILDKKGGIEYKDVLQILEYQDFGDSYNSACPNKPYSYKLLGTKVLQKGPVTAALELRFENNTRLVFSLSNKSKYFSVEAKFNNNKKNRKIQASFKLKNPITSTFAEDAFGYIERKHDYNLNPAVSMPAKPRIEVKTNSRPMQRWALAQGFGVISLGINEYDVYKNEFKITLIRSTGRISEPKNLARYVPAGPPIETPGLQCLGFCDLKFAIAPSIDIKGIQQVADAFYEPVVPILGDFNFGREKNGFNLLEKLPEGLLFYGLKPGEGKVFGVFYNTSSKKLKYKGKTVSPKCIEFIEL